MTTTFDISTQTLKRTFRERIADLNQRSFVFGLLKLLLFIIFLVPLILFVIVNFVYDFLTKREKTIGMNQPKNWLIHNPSLNIKSVDLENAEFYNKMKRLYGLDASDVDDIDDVCFIESEPKIDYFTDKLFTRTMTEFAGGVIMQEVNFEDWTSKLIFLKSPSLETEIIKELDFTYDLTFEKTNERELKIIMRKPGDKKVLLVKKINYP